MVSEQATLPFFEAATLQPIHKPRLRGAWSQVRFTADGGLLEPLNLPRELWHEPLEYRRPPGFILESSVLGDPDEGDDHERVAAFVEAAADTLFRLLQDAAEIDRVTRRIAILRASHHHVDVAVALRDEVNHINLLYAESLEEYSLIMGGDDAHHLDEWLTRLAQGLVQPDTIPRREWEEWDDEPCAGVP